MFSDGAQQAQLSEPMTRWESADADPSVLAQCLRFPYAGKVVAPNRFMKSAMSEQLATYQHNDLKSSGIPTREMMNLYEKFASGGFGVIVTGAIMVNANNLEAPGNVIIDKSLDAEDRRVLFEDWARTAKKNGSVFLAQLYHPGDKAANLPNKTKFNVNSLGEKQLNELVEQYAYAAAFAQECGFNGVEVSCAYNSALQQFLTEGVNKREDDYGGSLENRARILFRIIQAIRLKIRKPSTFVIGIKLSSDSFEPGYNEDDFGKFIRSVEKRGYDYIAIAGGHFYLLKGMKDVDSKTKKHEQFYQNLTPVIKKNLTRSKLYLNGGFVTLADMCQAINDRMAMGISLARPVAAEPELPNKLMDGEVKGAVKSLIDPLDFTTSQDIAGTQLWQHAWFLPVMDASNAEQLEQFKKDLAAHEEKKATAEIYHTEPVVGYPKTVLCAESATTEPTEPSAVTAAEQPEAEITLEEASSEQPKHEEEPIEPSAVTAAEHPEAEITLEEASSEQPKHEEEPNEMTEEYTHHVVKKQLNNADAPSTLHEDIVEDVLHTVIRRSSGDDYDRIQTTEETIEKVIQTKVFSEPPQNYMETVHDEQIEITEVPAKKEHHEEIKAGVTEVPAKEEHHEEVNAEVTEVPAKEEHHEEIGAEVTEVPAKEEHHEEISAEVTEVPAKEERHEEIGAEVTEVPAKEEHHEEIGAEATEVPAKEEHHEEISAEITEVPAKEEHHEELSAEMTTKEAEHETAAEPTTEEALAKEAGEETITDRFHKMFDDVAQKVDKLAHDVAQKVEAVEEPIEEIAHKVMHEVAQESAPSAPTEAPTETHDEVEEAQKEEQASYENATPTCYIVYLNNDRDKGAGAVVESAPEEEQVKESEKETVEVFEHPAEISGEPTETKEVAEQEPYHVTDQEAPHVADQESAHVADEESAHAADHELPHVTDKELPHEAEQEPAHVADHEPVTDKELPHVSDQEPHVADYELPHETDKELPHEADQELPHEPEHEPAHVADHEPLTDKELPHVSDQEPHIADHELPHVTDKELPHEADQELRHVADQETPHVADKEPPYDGVTVVEEISALKIEAMPEAAPEHEHDKEHVVTEVTEDVSMKVTAEEEKPTEKEVLEKEATSEIITGISSENEPIISGVAEHEHDKEHVVAEVTEDVSMKVTAEEEKPAEKEEVLEKEATSEIITGISSENEPIISGVAEHEHDKEHVVTEVTEDVSMKVTAEEEKPAEKEVLEKEATSEIITGISSENEPIISGVAIDESRPEPEGAVVETVEGTQIKPVESPIKEDGMHEEKDEHLVSAEGDTHRSSAEIIAEKFAPVGSVIEEYVQKVTTIGSESAPNGVATEAHDEFHDVPDLDRKSPEHKEETLMHKEEITLDEKSPTHKEETTRDEKSPVHEEEITLDEKSPTLKEEIRHELDEAGSKIDSFIDSVKETVDHIGEVASDKLKDVKETAGHIEEVAVDGIKDTAGKIEEAAGKISEDVGEAVFGETHEHPSTHDEVIDAPSKTRGSLFGSSAETEPATESDKFEPLERDTEMVGDELTESTVIVDDHLVDKHSPEHKYDHVEEEFTTTTITTEGSAHVDEAQQHHEQVTQKPEEPVVTEKRSGFSFITSALPDSVQSLFSSKKTTTTTTTTTTKVSSPSVDEPSSTTAEHSEPSTEKSILDDSYNKFEGATSDAFHAAFDRIENEIRSLEKGDLKTSKHETTKEVIGGLSPEHMPVVSGMVSDEQGGSQAPVDMTQGTALFSSEASGSDDPTKDDKSHTEYHHEKRVVIETRNGETHGYVYENSSDQKSPHELDFEFIH